MNDFFTVSNKVALHSLTWEYIIEANWRFVCVDGHLIRCCFAGHDRTTHQFQRQAEGGMKDTGNVH